MIQDSNLLTGIVLMGGKSSRMGTDKSRLTYNSEKGEMNPAEKQQTFSELAYDKLKPFCSDIFYSINSEQNTLELPNTVIDVFEGEGPLGGIISSMRTTQKSIMIVAVDMPLVSTSTLRKLVEYRDWNLLSTSYYSKENNIWDPFPSIWEIEALPCLEEYFESGERSFQKFLNKYGHQQVPISSEKDFTNVNTMEQYIRLPISS
ncbi:molybdenum cofactor guanylyltransferase [Bacteroidia bacterium]|nr:molybdenum cofactor guanylyltransferase [Bacteroidia bacterium]MDB4106902.1 molybdenum cofactor guanylyltransferase [Bacteroidia bacterium]MDB9882710.1 molybdenum cofactor guanylyltransferase [Bacteroidia bacterium]